MKKSGNVTEEKELDEICDIAVGNLHGYISRILNIMVIPIKMK